uniref:Protein kinase domain-containing protein n=1 Tax=Fagus sylvatica TaxID=28930 RepID=A0A2N9IG42_FAGSY
MLILLIGIVLAIIWEAHSIGALEEVEVSLILFKYQDIRRATKNFSQTIGEGNFGSVFKGTLPNSTAIAVKKIRSLQQEASKRFLVYEYMPKGSLESHLFQNVSMILDWKTRYHIAIGTAKGLAYLHESCRDFIIHFDIKLENILLDAEDVPKVADFGLAKLWVKLLFEIVSGRRNINMLDDEICNYFPARVAITMNKGEDLLTLLDYKLEGNANVEELTRACKVACWCIQDDPKDRPTMGQVVKILEGIMQVGMPQIPLYFQRLSENPTEAIVYHETETSTSSY